MTEILKLLNSCPVFLDHHTIEQYYLMHKIEKVKELLVYDQLTLTEIAWKLHYSSVSHLSNQFKKMTGLTPTQFKNLKHNRRSALNDL
ncbi:MAG: helix-turn-helix transcriptional regulator [Bacteroidales bacterium]|nr:helix-turn-helix transcriptional regulator [Bacteroidales bacterium]MBN2699542.1 helix-turn-helix transcriptional regulator [Bacteroidales bacterium]